jgi:predicted thioesterase
LSCVPRQAVGRVEEGVELGRERRLADVVEGLGELGEAVAAGGLLALIRHDAAQAALEQRIDDLLDALGAHAAPDQHVAALLPGDLLREHRALARVAGRVDVGDVVARHADAELLREEPAAGDVEKRQQRHRQTRRVKRSSADGDRSVASAP